MADRFDRLFQLPKNLYSNGSPVLVVAGVLLKDTHSGKLVIQLKFQSVACNTIKALKVKIVAFDSTGEVVENAFEYQYLDLNVKSGGTFGSQKAIILSNPVIRSFELRSIASVMEDGSVRDVVMPLAMLPEPRPLQSIMNNTELVKQYQIEINQKACYAPKKHGDIWLCPCGTWNVSAGCTACNANRKDVFLAYSPEVLVNNTTIRLEREKAEQEAKAEQDRLEALERERRKSNELACKKARAKKVKKFAAITIPIILFALLFFLWIYPDIVLPLAKYNAAQGSFANGNYDDAIIAFTELEDYKDSALMVNESSYQKAMYLLDTACYDDAIAIFESLDNYSASYEKIQEAKYRKACKLSETGNLKSAIDLLNSLDESYQENIDIEALNYQYARELFDEGSLDKAKNIFESINSYKDSDIWVQECDYVKACEYYAEKKYAVAAKVFESLEQYKDSANLVIECKYHDALSLMEQKQYEKAVTVFEKIGDYMNAIELLKECKYLQAKLSINRGDYSLAESLFSEITGYKDSTNYLELLTNAISVVVSAEAKYTSDTEYVWIVSEINTANCTSRLLAYEGRSNYNGVKIDYVSDRIMKLSKNENGYMLMTPGGQDPSMINSAYWVWSVSGNWNTIHHQVYVHGRPNGSPGEYDVYWKRLDDNAALTVKQSYVDYFRTNKNGDWAESKWLAAKALLDFHA